MTRFIHRHRPLLGSCLVVVIGFTAVLIVTALTTQKHHAVTKAHLIPAVTIYHAAPTGGGPIWGGETWVPSPFRRAQLHHPWCGRRISPQRRGIHGIYRMTFQHCAMALGPIKVYRLPTPLPEQGVVGGILGGTATPRPIYVPPPPTVRPLPTNPAPAATPLPTSAHPTLIPTRLPPLLIATPTAIPPGGASNDSAAYELSLMNQTRIQAGLSPYTENITESNGTATCVGSYGHALHMSQIGQISHDQFPADICLNASAAGENVGESGGSVMFALQTIHNLMMSEPHSPGCTGNHACNILSSAYRQVGIGVVTTGGGTYLAVDFIS